MNTPYTRSISMIAIGWCLNDSIELSKIEKNNNDTK